MPVSSDEPNLALRDTDPGIRPLMNPDARTISSAVLAPLNVNAEAGAVSGGAVSGGAVSGGAVSGGAVSDVEANTKPSQAAAGDGGLAENHPLHRRVARGAAHVFGEGLKLYKGKSENEGVDADDNPETTPLDESIYTLIFTAPYNSLAFYFSLGAFCSVMIYIVLDIRTIVKKGSKGNILEVPPGVDVTVQLAQAVTLFAIALWQTDVTDALARVHNGYDAESVEKSGIKSATRIKWHMANAAQILFGSGLLFDGFLKVVRTVDVQDLLFVLFGLFVLSSIDDKTFAYVKKAPGSSVVFQTYKDAKKLEVRQKSNVCVYAVMYIVIALGLLVPWGILNGHQRAGKYVCQKLYIQAGDLYQSQVPLVSGTYELSGSASTNVDNRVVYVYQLPPGHQKPYVDGEQPPKIQYSIDSKAWTYVVDDKIVAKSPKSELYDVTQTTPDQWLVRNSASGQFITVDFLTLKCIDCTGGGGLCGKNGKCDESNRCVCNDGRYGLNCEYGAFCNSLALDARKPDFPPRDLGTSSFANKFEVLKDDENKSIEVTYRPAYVYFYPADEGFGGFDILLYLGRRWMLSDNFSFGGRNFTSKSDLVAYLQKDFHPFYSTYKAYVLSSPTDFGTTTDAYTPVSLEWFQAVDLAGGTPSFRIDLTQNVESVLLCSICDNVTNPCLNYGTCNSTTSKCECFGIAGSSPLYTGSLCESTTDCNQVKIPSGGCFFNQTCYTDGTCDCPDGYVGDFCLFPESCEKGGDYKCQNGGTCGTPWLPDGSKVCACPDGFSGAFCELENTNVATSTRF